MTDDVRRQDVFLRDTFWSFTPLQFILLWLPVKSRCNEKPTVDDDVELHVLGFRLTF